MAKKNRLTYTIKNTSPINPGWVAVFNGDNFNPRFAAVMQLATFKVRDQEGEEDVDVGGLIFRESCLVLADKEDDFKGMFYMPEEYEKALKAQEVEGKDFIDKLFMPGDGKSKNGSKKPKNKGVGSDKATGDVPMA